MNWLQPNVYAVKHKDESIRAASRSGGIFTALSDIVLENKGVVYGCILTDDFMAVHVRADSFELRNQMRGSKYIQSRLGETLKRVKLDLNMGRKVLFSGTSCQVAGLKNFLGKEYSTLLCVDIVCHGVPSYIVWKKYLNWWENKIGSKVISVDFRNKKDFGWCDHVETLSFDNGKVINSQIFKNIFYGHLVLRPSCYECPYKSVMHPGDITIADYWGIDKAAPGFNDNKGVSLVLINNTEGKLAFENVRNNLQWKATHIEDSMQTPLKAPFPKPQNRNEFWKDLGAKDFKFIAKKYGGYGLQNKIQRKIGALKRKLLN